MKYIHYVKITFLTTFLLLVSVFSWADGTRQASPTNSADGAALLIAPDLGYGSYRACPNDNRIRFTILNNATENLYFGFNTRDYSTANTVQINNVYYRIFNAAGTQVVGATLIPTAGNGFISTYAQAFAGPNIGGATPTGYAPLTFDPATNGDFYIEIYRSNDAGATMDATGAGRVTMPFFDFTVATAANVQSIGRVWSRKWAFVTTNLTSGNFEQSIASSFTGDYYAYTPDQFIVQVQFQPGFRPLAYEIAMNFNGTANTGNFLNDRRSTSTTATLTNGYQVFLTTPDPAAFPTGTTGYPAFTNSIYGCPGNYFIPYYIDQAGDVGIVLDLDGTPGYQPGTDVELTAFGVTPGNHVMAWNGLNGSGAAVPVNFSAQVQITLYQGRTNIPMNDAEMNINGLSIISIFPASGSRELYWDDTNIAAVGTCGGTGDNNNNITTGGVQGVVLANGILGPTHAWNGSNPTTIVPAPASGQGSTTGLLCDDYGNSRCINTWFYAVDLSSPVVTMVLPSCDKDNDGISDNTDLDDDNDGVADLVENGGLPDATADADSDGIPNYIDPTAAGFVDVNFDGVDDRYDFDRDGVINSFDLDSDNDGIVDLRENNQPDANSNGQIDGFVDFNANGLSDAVDPNCTSPSTGRATANAGATNVTNAANIVNANAADFGTVNQNTGVIDLDFGSILPVGTLISATVASSTLGVATGTVTFSTDDVTYFGAFPYSITGTAVQTQSFQLTAATRYMRIAATGGGNTRVYIVNFNVCNGTIGTAITPVNTDGNGGPNYLDIDSDNDGIVDNSEAQTTAGYIAPSGSDSDKDGIDNAYDATAGFGGAGVTPTNTDGADTPDYIDLNSDNDAFNDAIEGWDTNGDEIANTTPVGTDTDGDGLDDAYDVNDALINPTNGTTPSTYPNLNVPGTTERDWRETFVAPTVSISGGTTIAENSAGTVTLTVSLSSPTSVATTVNLTYTGTATSGTDYVAGVASVTIPAGATSATLVIDPNDDVTYEGNETVITTISSVSGGNGATIGAPSSTTTTIVENEAVPTVTLTGTTTVAENSGTTVTLTATLSVPTTVATTVTLTYTGTATSGTDYTASSTTITIPAGSTTGTVTVTPINDGIYEGSETVIADITNVTGGNGATENGTQTATVTITDEEAVPTVTLTGTTTVAENSGTAVTLTATLSVPTTVATVVTLTYTGTATSGTDYTASSTTITIPAGSTTGTVTVTPINDGTYEGSETVIADITNVTGGNGATENGTQTATVTITDDEAVPTVTLTGTTTVAENSGTAVTLTATLSVPTTVATVVTLTYTGTATSGTDYTASSTTITIPAGSTTGTVTVTPINDGIYEGSETVIADITNVTGGNGATENGTQTATVTITDDEAVPTVTLTGTTTVAENSGTAVTLTATLSVPTTVATVVTLTYTGTATSGTDYNASSTTITIPAGSTTGTVTVTPINDGTYEGSETVIADITNVAGGNGATENGIQTATVTITDDEAVPTVTLTGTTTVAENSGTAVTLTATLSVPTTVATVVTLTYTGTATSGTDYTASSTTITIPAGSTTGTVTVTPVDDAIYELTETVVVDITNVTGGNGATENGTQTATVTITDNDNSIPVAVDNSASTNEDVAVVLPTIQTNDTDVDGSVVVGTIDLDPATAGQQTTFTNAQGTWTVNTTTGDVTYTPAANFNGTATIPYTIQDNSGATSNQANLTVTVAPINDAPIVDNDVNTIPEDGGPATGDLTDAGDSDPDGTTLTVNTTPVSGPTNGTIIINADGTYSYTPNANFNGTDVITVQICDAGTPLPAQCVTQTLTITVTPVNDAPVAVDNSASTNEDVAVVLPTIQTNDTDVDGSVVVGTIDLDPATAGQQTTFTNAQGTWTVNTITGDVTYTPAANFNGTATIPYTIQDNSGATSNQANLTVTVAPINDAPIVDNDVNTIPEDGGPATGDLTDAGDSDPDGTTLTVNTTPVSGPTNGTIIINADGTYTYTPNANFFGTDVITVQICDAGTPLPAICVTQTLTITVTAVNDAPIAVGNSASTNEDVVVVLPTIQTNDTDVDGSVVVGTIDLDPATPGQQTTFTNAQGTWTVNTTTGDVTYTPAANFNGTATIPYTIQDNSGATSNQANLTVTVAPINDAPIVDNDVNTIPEDGGPATGDLTDAGDSDPDGTTLTVNTTPVSGPTNGTIIINADGTYSYTPNANFFGTDVITVQICDAGTPLPAICVTQTLTITVTPVNDAPVAVDNSASTDEDVAVVLPTIQTNDTDVDGSVVVGTIDLDPATAGQQTTFTNAQGTWTVNTTTGDVTYTPAANFNGTATIPYTIQDNSGATSNQANLTVTVAPINDAPIVDNDVNTIPEDGGPATGDLTDAGDSDPDGTTLTVNTTPVSGPTNGTIIINADGTYSYTPNANFFGTDVITVQICDAGTPLPAQCVTQTLTITVTPVNDAPVAVGNSATTNEDVAVVLPTIQTNDTDVDGSVVVGTIDLDPATAGQQTTFTNAQGTWTVNTTTGDVTFTPASNFNGTATIPYTIQDNSGATSNQANLTVTVAPVNDAPIVDNDVNTIPEDGGPATGDLTDAGDSDPDGTTLTVNTTPVSGPTNGTIFINADGTYSYTPNANFFGTDVITVQICDAGTPLPAQCVTQTLTITVTPVNDAPIVDNDVNTIPEDGGPATGDLTDAGDSDPDGTTLTVNTTPVSGPTNGTIIINADGTYSYTPNANFNGTDVITVQICDAGTPLPAQCVTQTLTITVTPVNDAPVAVDNSASTNEDVAVVLPTIQTNDTDVDGSVVVGTIDLDPATAGQQTTFTNAQGTWTVNTTTGNVTYTPAANFNGTATIPYTIQDNSGATSNQANLTVTVAPINDAPIVDNEFISVPQNGSQSGDLTDIGDSDVDGTTLTATTTPVSGPTNGTILINPDGTFTYTANTGYVGNDMVVVSICDAGLPLPAICVNDTIFITVLPTVPPVANNDNATTNEDTPITFLITGNDTDADGSINTASVDLNPGLPGIQSTLTTVEGTWSVNATGFVTFTPASNFNGTASINYTVNDNLGATSNTAVISVVVTPVNDAPIVDNDVNTIPEDGGPATGDLTDAGDSDPDGTTLTVNTTPVSGPTNGTIIINADGTYSYTPNPNFNGTDVITVQICDAGTPLPAICVTQTLTITVTPVNDAPVAVDNSASTNEEVAVVLPTIQTNDTDVDGSVVVGTIDLDPATAGQQTTFSNAQGTWTVNTTTGDVTYTPAANFNGTATIPYTIQDNSGATSNQANLTVTVAPINDAPIVDNDVNTIPEDGGPATGDLTDAGDSDPDGTTLTVNTTPVSGPTNGTIIINADGTYTYTPNANFFGTDVITVQICDAGTPLPAQCVTQTLTITVTPVNDAPVAVDNSASTNEDVAVVLPTIQTNDTDVDGSVVVGTIDLDPATAGQQTTFTNAQGTWTVNTTTGDVTYTPAANFNGTATIPYTIQDNSGATSNQANLTVTVAPINDAPIVDNDVNTIPEDGGPATGDLTDAGDSDPDGTTLTVNTTPVSGPTNGTIIINTDGTYSYTPNPNFNGTDTIVVSICDQGLPLPGICVNDTLIVTVSPINDAPVIDNEVITTTVNTGVSGDVTNAGDFDVDGNLVVNTTPISGPSNGTITINPDGTFTYIPSTGFTGSDTVVVSICDDGTPLPALCVNDTIFITVLACPNPVDTDGDGLTDCEELTGVDDPTTPAVPTVISDANNSCDPIGLITTDTDNDGLTDCEETTGNDDPSTPAVPAGTSNPNNSCDPIGVNTTDTDGDGLTDCEETTGNDNPSTPAVPTGTSNPNNSCDPIGVNTADTDNDGLTDCEEITGNDDPSTPAVPTGTSNPNNSCDPIGVNTTDTDSDGLTDCEETTGNDDPSTPAVPTGTSDPNNPCSPIGINTADTDSDGLTDCEETTGNDDPSTPAVPTGTSDPNNPCSPIGINTADTDNDGLTDCEETTGNDDPSTPAVPTGTSDPNNPCSPIGINTADTDNDGLTDCEESTGVDDPSTPAVPTGTSDPNNPCSPIGINTADTDNDGLTDCEETTGVDDPSTPAVPTGTSDPNNPCSPIGNNTTDTDGDGLTDCEETTGEDDPSTPGVPNGTSNPNDPCSPKNCDFSVPEAFTPDGDGVNDTFVIAGIEQFPENNIIIFNRWGNEVFTMEKYDNSWNGTSDSGLNVGGDELPTGTYYYIFDTRTKEYGVIKGYIYLKR